MDTLKKQKLREILSKRELLELARINRSTVRFSGQNKDELVFALFREAAIRNLGWLLQGIGMIALSLFFPVIINLFSQLQIITIKIDALDYSLLYIFYYSIFLSWVVIKFSDWYFDVFIITNERFIEIKFKPFSTVNVREIWLEDIEVIKTTTSGILGSFFKYGDLRITTRSERGGTLLKHVPNQEQKKNLLSDLAKIARKYRRLDI